jgi:hypothetical protein
MLETSINRSVLQDISWWHWALTAPLLAAHLAGVEWALAAAIMLCGLVGGYFYARVGQWRPYPVQIRLAYLGLLLVGSLPAMAWLHWVQVFGTTAMVMVGYCPLARALNLLPWNRNEPFTLALVWRSIFRDPTAGGIFQDSNESGAACSLRRVGI